MALRTVLNTVMKENKNYKFGHRVPKNAREALEIDQEEGNSEWRTSMTLEIDQLNQYKTFIVVPDGEPMPKGYKRIPYSTVFDVKFDGRKKTRVVAGGHRTPEVPKEEIFSGVVSMEAVRLGFIIANLNNLLVCAGDIGNAILNGRTREKFL